MKKIIIGLAIVLLLGAVYAMTQISGTDSFVREYQGLDTTAAEIEMDLVALQKGLDEGSLSENDAVAAHTRIKAKLATFDQVYTAAQGKTLTKEQQDAMLDTLSNIKDILMRYQSTLVSVDTIVAKKMGKSFSGSITQSFKDTVATAEEQTDDAVENYDADQVDLDQATEIFIEDIMDGEIDSDTTVESEIEITTDEPMDETEEGTGVIEEAQIETEATMEANVEADTTLVDPAN